MEISKTDQGLEIITFTDRNNRECVLQQSNLADRTQYGASAIWFGRYNNEMHIDLEQLIELTEHLQNWIKKGSFEKKSKMKTEQIDTFIRMHEILKSMDTNEFLSLIQEYIIQSVKDQPSSHGNATRGMKWSIGRKKHKNQELIPLTEEDIKEYLDNCITSWRKTRNESTDQKERECSRHYIDAFQAARLSIFGEPLD